MLEKALSQVSFDVNCEVIGADLIDPGHEGPAGDHDQYHLKPKGNIGESFSLQENTVDNATDIVGLDDRQQPGQETGKNG
jgi:hypothetical protein